MPDDEIELIAVHDEVALAVRPLVDCCIHDVDTAEIMPDVIAHEFVVIARNIDDLDAFMDAFQQLADDIVVRFRPIPAGFQPPAVDDIADQIDRIDVAMLEEIEQEACLATFCSQMQIGQEECPDGEAVEMFFRHGSDSGREIMSLAE